MIFLDGGQSVEIWIPRTPSLFFFLNRPTKVIGHSVTEKKKNIFGWLRKNDKNKPLVTTNLK